MGEHLVETTGKPQVALHASSASRRGLDAPVVGLDLPLSPATGAPRLPPTGSPRSRSAARHPLPLGHVGPPLVASSACTPLSACDLSLPRWSWHASPILRPPSTARHPLPSWDASADVRRYGASVRRSGAWWRSQVFSSEHEHDSEPETTGSAIRRQGWALLQPGIAPPHPRPRPRGASCGSAKS